MIQAIFVNNTVALGAFAAARSSKNNEVKHLRNYISVSFKKGFKDVRVLKVFKVFEKNESVLGLYPDIGQVAGEAVEVESVSDYEVGGDFKPYIVRFDVLL